MGYKLLISLGLLTSCVTVEKGLVCPGTVMVGWDKPEAMKPDDYNAFITAKNRCPTKFPDKRSPCLKKFVKLGELNYYAECGQPKESNK